MSAARKVFDGLSSETLAKLGKIRGKPIEAREGGGPVYPVNDLTPDDPLPSQIQEGAPQSAPPPAAAPVAAAAPANAGPVDKAFVAGFGTNGDTDPANPPGIPIANEREAVANGQAVPTMPAYTVPAHWQPGSHEVHMQHGYSDEELAPVAGAQGERLEAEERAGETANAIGHQQGIHDAAYANAVAQATDKYQTDYAAIQEQRARYVEMERRKLDELALSTQQKVDPDAYFKEKGTFATVLGALAVGLGQFGASLSGGQNAAMQIIQAQIDRNIRAQEANIDNAHKAYDTRTNLFAQNLAAFGDREKAVMATRINGLDQFGSMLDAKLADESLPLKERQAAQQLRERVSADRAQVLKEFMTLAHTQVSEAENEHFVSAQTVGGGPKAEATNLVTLPDGTSVQMPNEKTQNEAIAKMQVLDKIQRMNNRALKLRKEITELDPIADRTKYASLYTQLQDLQETKAAMISTASQQGVLREAEYERMVKMQTHFTRGVGFFKGVPVYSQSERDVADNAIRAQNDVASEDARAYVKAAGGHIVQRGYASDATGNVKPVSKYTGQDVKGAEGLPPRGFKPMDSRQQVPTAAPPVRETTPKAPVLGTLPAGTSANDNAKKGGRKGPGHMSTKRIR